MMTTTVRAVLEHAFDPGEELYGIYVVREGDIVLYVGRSQDPHRRLGEHFGLSWRDAGSSLSSFYEEHPKEALDWHIDLYSLEECDVYVQEHFPHHLKWYQSHRPPFLPVPQRTQ